MTTISTISEQFTKTSQKWPRLEWNLMKVICDVIFGESLHAQVIQFCLLLRVFIVHALARMDMENQISTMYLT